MRPSLTTGSGGVIVPRLTTGSGGVIVPRLTTGSGGDRAPLRRLFYLGLCRLRGILSPPASAMVILQAGNSYLSQRWCCRRAVLRSLNEALQ